MEAALTKPPPLVEVESVEPLLGPLLSPAARSLLGEPDGAESDDEDEGIRALTASKLRAQHERAVALRPLRRAWAALRMVALARRTEARLHLCAHAARLCAALQRWRQCSAHDMACTICLYHATVAGAVGLQLRALRRWAYLPRARSLMRLGDYMHVMHASAAHWRLWLLLAAASRREKRLMGAANTARRRLACRRVVHQWRTFARAQALRRGRRRVQRRAQRNLRRAWARWRKHTSASRLPPPGPYGTPGGALGMECVSHRVSMQPAADAAMASIARAAMHAPATATPQLPSPKDPLIRRPSSAARLRDASAAARPQPPELSDSEEASDQAKDVRQASDGGVGNR